MSHQARPGICQEGMQLASTIYIYFTLWESSRNEILAAPYTHYIEDQAKTTFIIELASVISDITRFDHLVPVGLERQGTSNKTTVW